MKDQKSPPDLAFVRQQIERLEAELAIWKNTEQGLLAVKDGEFTMGLKGVFKGMRPIEAICEFLKRERRPMSRQSIIRAVIEGGAKLGANKQKSVNQSISTNMGKKLREMNGLIGLTWPDEKFIVDR
jgi:hypothetical protein